MDKKQTAESSSNVSLQQIFDEAINEYGKEKNEELDENIADSDEKVESYEKEKAEEAIENKESDVEEKNGDSEILKKEEKEEKNNIENEFEEAGIKRGQKNENEDTVKKFGQATRKKVNKQIESKKSKKKFDKRFSIALILVFLVLVIASAASFLVCWNDLLEGEAKADEFSEKVSFYGKTVNVCLGLLNNEEGVNLDLDSGVIAECVEGIEQVDEQFDVSAIKASIADASDYLEVIGRIEPYFDENAIVLASADFGAVDEISESVVQLKDGYREYAEGKMDVVKSERDKMNYAKEKVDSLFSGESVAGWATLGAYNEIKGIVDGLSQEDLKAELYKKLEIVYPVVEERYRIEQERIRREREEAERRAREYQAKVAAAWHTINIPYISQNNNGVNNGCEAASLLMALKAKGYASNVGYIDFVNNMPKSDDPNTGFYLDVYKSEPRDEAHWIAPAPLATYGASVGGGAVNITGTGVDGLDAEVANGNPVVAYVTFNFGGAGKYSKGVPNNLHVVVLAGYNEVTGEQVIVDPWTSGGRTKYNISKAAFQNAYRASGYRAVVVR